MTFFYSTVLRYSVLAYGIRPIEVLRIVQNDVNLAEFWQNYPRWRHRIQWYSYWPHQKYFIKMHTI